MGYIWDYYSIVVAGYIRAFSMKWLEIPVLSDYILFPVHVWGNERKSSNGIYWHAIHRKRNDQTAVVGIMGIQQWLVIIWPQAIT